MKLILIPDNPVCPFGVANRPKIAISIPGDNYTVHDILEKLVTPALVAMLFHPQTISDGYHDAQVMGARDEEEKAAPEWREEPDAPTPPEGYTVVGFGIEGPDQNEILEDLMFRAERGDWYTTPYADGGVIWYAARNGSETLAKLRAHVASL